ncbi:hypothetical protein [Massilia soli]|uniref:Tetratricopeptide repeat protein n=1 Tax=Massilia soli TaxID=2792854 RepID=A0ABS7SS70_9BURK|nr:hypothetical protein [Massilia soli]MBZ2208796.1 hypothetical protein [Massilia soli]
MTSFTAKPLAGALLAAALCAPQLAHADYAAELARMKAAPQKDATLVTLQAGLAALSENRLPEARRHFDDALDVIEGMFANTQAAANARSLWYEEGAKEFKGEPYERAMAFYYRGLAYLIEADYENARASFRSGLMQDAFAEEQQNRSDFTSLMLLEGWTNQLLGAKSQAGEAYQEAVRLRAGLPVPPAGANVLVIAELGGSPRKVGDGIDNQEIVYRGPKRTPERSVSIDIDGKAVRPVLIEDVFFQASTRGGRPIDRLIAGKASFKETSGEIGMALTSLASESSLMMSAVGGKGGGNVMGGLAAIGAISSIISANVKPRADVRYWNNLPETLHATAFTHTGLPANISVKLFDDSGNAVQSDKLAINKWIDRNGNVLIWIKSRT